MNREAIDFPLASFQRQSNITTFESAIRYIPALRFVRISESGINQAQRLTDRMEQYVSS